MSMVMDLSPEEQALLRDVIDNWTEGVHDAKVLTTTDPTIESAEQLCDLMSGYDEQLTTLQRIRKKVLRAE